MLNKSRHGKGCSLNPEDMSLLYIKEVINGNEKFKSIGRYCKSCNKFFLNTEWTQTYQIMKKNVKFRIKGLKLKIIGDAFSIGSIGFLIFLLIGLIEHHFKLI